MNDSEIKTASPQQSAEIAFNVLCNAVLNILYDNPEPIGLTCSQISQAMGWQKFVSLPASNKMVSCVLNFLKAEGRVYFDQYHSKDMIYILWSLTPKAHKILAQLDGGPIPAPNGIMNGELN